jgi:DNA-binding transcriptional MerR regulator
MSAITATIAHENDDIANSVKTSNDDYARIGEVSEQFNVTLRTLRFYEDKGLITPKRVGVTRLYSRKDRARIKLIIQGKKVGFSLREVKHLIELYEPGGSNTVQMRAIMNKSIKQLDKMKAQRAAVDEAIDELVNGINMLADRLGSERSVAA